MVSITCNGWMARQARALEPALSCVAALWSPSTGIVDSHALMLALQGDAERFGATLALHTPLLSARCREQGFELHMGGSQPMTLHCRELINCAGLSAPKVARTIIGLPGSFIPEAHLCKGSYFSFSGRAPFRHLVYPAPESAGLGVHMTLDLGGQARFGPDVEWVEHIDYRVEPRRAEGFYQAIRRYWPDLPDNSLQPAYSGIRPKITGPTEPAADFRHQRMRRTWRAGIGESVRHRITGADQLPGARRARGETPERPMISAGAALRAMRVYARECAYCHRRTADDHRTHCPHAGRLQTLGQSAPV